MKVCSHLEGSFRDAVQLVVGQDEVPQVHQALEVGVVQDGQAVGVHVQGVQLLEVSEGVRPDLADGVSAEGQVDLEVQTTTVTSSFLTNLSLKNSSFTPIKCLYHPVRKYTSFFLYS